MTETASREALLDADLRHHWHPYTDMAGYPEDQFLVVRAEGSRVMDADGRWYVDAISGLWNMNVGYGRDEIVQAVAEQLATLPYQPLNGRSHEPATHLAQRLAELVPGDLNRVFFATGGAEAVETALKMCRAYWLHAGQPRRRKVIGLEHGWHGCTLGALAASGIAEEKSAFEPLAGGFLRFIPPEGGIEGTAPPGAVDAALERLVTQEDPGTVAALIGEPIQGLAGMIAPAPSFWAEVQQVCHRHQLLIVADEVAMGFGRTGRMFSHEHYNLHPDMVTCAKGITGGFLPLSAVMVSERVFEPFRQPGRTFMHGYTWGGHPASCAAALAVLDILEREELVSRAQVLGDRLRERLTDGLAGSTAVAEVRGTGLALAVRLALPPGPAAAACRHLLSRGVLVRPVGDGDAVPLLPPLSIPEDLALQVVDLYVEEVRRLDDRRPHPREARTDA